MEILVRTQTPSEKTTAFELAGGDFTVEALKSKFQEALGFGADEQPLIFAGKEIENGSTGELSEKMLIFVKSPSGKLLAFEVELDDTIHTLKAKIYETEGYAVEDQRLVYAGQQLEDGLTVADYELANESTVDLVMRLLGGGRGRFRIPPYLLDLARKYNEQKMICRKCYARLPPRATKCRKKKCGYSNQLRKKKPFVAKDWA